MIADYSQARGLLKVLGGIAFWIVIFCWCCYNDKKIQEMKQNKKGDTDIG